MKQPSYFLSVLCVVLSGGCIPQIIDLSDLLPPGTNEDQKQIKRYDGKVYIIGCLTSNLKEEFEAAMTFSDYVAGATDGPIVVSSDALGNLTQAQLDGLLSAYGAGESIILVNASADQVRSFGKQFIGETFSFELPEGMSYVEVFAIDLEHGEHVWQWVMYPPDETNGEDTQAQQQDRLGDLIDWIQANELRMESMPPTMANAANDNGTSNDLTQVASVFVDQAVFCKLGNRYQITHYVYSCHSFETGDDWFYVQQQCVFNGGGAYGEKIVESNRESKGLYMDRIEINSTLRESMTCSPSPLIQSSPETTKDADTVISGVNFVISGDVAVDKNGQSKRISGGVTIKNSQTINIQGCEITNASNDQEYNTHWIYQFDRCEAISTLAHRGLSDPPALSINKFQPINQCIWQVPSNLRWNYSPIRVKLSVGLCRSWGRTDLFWADSIEHWTSDGGSWEYKVFMPYPPLTVEK